MSLATIKQYIKQRQIEEAFSKLKTILRRAGARTKEALEEAIGHALLTITAQDAQG